MKGLAVAAVAGGVGLGIVGIGYMVRSRPKAEERRVEMGASPVVPAAGVVPTHPGVQDNRATYCQLLTAYRSDLKKQEDLLANAEAQMRRIEREAESLCRIYAANPVFQYHCNGFPICHWSHWYTVSGQETDSAAYSLCTSYVRLGGELAPREHELRPGDNWDDTWDDLRRMNANIAQALRQIQVLRQQYVQMQKEADEARSQIARLRKQIADLEAQGVFC